MSRDYIHSILNKDVSVCTGNNIRKCGRTLKIEVNGHTYELTNQGRVTACFDGLNYDEAYSILFADIYDDIVTAFRL